MSKGTGSCNVSRAHARDARRAASNVPAPLRSLIADAVADGLLPLSALSSPRPSQYVQTLLLFTPAEEKDTHIDASVRAAVFERDGHQCQRCGETVSLVADHFVPQALGERESSERTLSTYCKSCNGIKGGDWPSEEAVEAWVASGRDLPPAYERLLRGRPWRDAGVTADEWLASVEKAQAAKTARTRRVGGWTPGQIRAELEPLLAGRDTWPSKQDFEAAELLDLHAAISSHGGIRSWAELMGMRHPQDRYSRLSVVSD